MNNNSQLAGQENLTEMKETKIMGMPGNIFFTGLTSFFTDTSTKMVYPVLPVFLTSVLGTSITSVSIIEGVAESTASILKALSGWCSDRLGRNKSLMITGYLITAVITPFFAFVSGWYQVLALRFLERMGKGVRTAPRDSIIAASGGKKNHGKNFGFHKAMDNSGAIIGPLLAYLILEFSVQGNGTPTAHDYRLLFILAAIPAFLGVLTICLFVKEAKGKTTCPDRIKWDSFRKDYYIFLLIVFIFSLGNSTDTLLLLRSQNIGIPEASVPLLYLIFNTCSVLFVIPMGALSDRIGREKIIILGYLVYSLVYLGFACANSKITVVMLFALYGLYSASVDGVQKALVADLIDKQHRGTGLGLYNAIIGITLLPASIIGGVLWSTINISAPFLFGMFTALLASVMLVFFYRKRRTLPC
ncbi:MFS transporter [Candidatus Formimonas warabiya]|nr:MFS transporter [Candidatus Formimonas warabiya]